MSLASVVQEVLALVESDGPLVVKQLVQQVAGALPSEVLFDLATCVVDLVESKSEKQEVQAAEAAIVAADVEAENVRFPEGA